MRISSAVENLVKERPRPRLYVRGDQVASLRETGTKQRELARQAIREYTQVHLGDPLPQEPKQMRLVKGKAYDFAGYRDLLLAARQVMRVCDILSFQYLLCGDRKAGEVAKQWALRAAEWDPDGATNIHDSDLGHGNIIGGLTHAYDWGHDLLTEKEEERLRNALVARLRRTHDFLTPAPHYHQGRTNNHSWMDAADLVEGALCLAEDLPEAAEWIEFVARLFIDQFLPSGDREGGWHEGITYVHMAVRPAMRVLMLLDRALGIDLTEDFPWLPKAPEFMMYCAPPDGQRDVEFNDVVRFRQIGDVLAMVWLASHYGNGTAQWYVDNSGLPALVERSKESWEYPLVELFLAAEREARPEPPTGKPLAKLFPDIGWMAAHSQWEAGGVTFAFKSGPFFGWDSGHDHADQNHFTVTAYGQRLIVDTGFYDWHASPHFLGWYMQSKAHNTVLVNGQGQMAFRAGADGVIGRFFHGNQHDYVMGEARHAYAKEVGARRFERRIIYLRPDWFVIYDDLLAAEPAAYQWLLHTPCPVTISQQEQRLDYARGGAAIAAQFLLPQGLNITQTTGYEEFPPDGPFWGKRGKVPEEWHVCAETAARERQAVFLTVVRAHRCEEGPLTAEAIAADNGVALKRKADGQTMALFRRPGLGVQIQVQAGSVAAAAEAACVHLDPSGKPTAFLLAHGRFLSLQGQTILESDRDVTVEALRTADGWKVTAEARFPVSLRIGKESIGLGPGRSQFRVEPRF